MTLQEHMRSAAQTTSDAMSELLIGGADRIAALEAALAERDRAIEQARVALERIRHATAPTHDDGGHHEAAHDLSIDALRKIEEVQK